MSGFGIEEEFFLFDRQTGLPAMPSREQTAQLTAITAGGGCTSTEWLTCQVETSTAIPPMAAQHGSHCGASVVRSGTQQTAWAWTQSRSAPPPPDP